MFKIAQYEDDINNILSVFIRPDDISDLTSDTEDFLRTIRIWKDGLKRIILKKILINLGIKETDQSNVLDRIIRISGELIDIIFDTIKSKTISLDPAKEKLRAACFNNRKINVYIDDLDRGWKGRQADINTISALLNAVRDLSNENPSIHFKIALCSDVYYLYRTSDESTDKVAGSVVWLTWSNHEILSLLVKRIETYFGRKADEDVLFTMDQQKLAEYLHVLMEPRFRGGGHWDNAPIHQVLMSLIRRRPRDLVKLCTLAAQNAQMRGAKLIGTEDWEDAFPSYSSDRLLDTEIEYKSELPDIRRLMLGMKPSVKKKKAKDSYQFTSEQLINKINSICQRGGFRFANNKNATEQQLAHFLYKINFLTGRRSNNKGIIVRKYFEEHNYLIQGDVDFGFSWEVHPAYRWALQPSDPQDIFERLDLLDFES
jgi:hypothetical protein